MEAPFLCSHPGNLSLNQCRGVLPPFILQVPLQLVAGRRSGICELWGSHRPVIRQSSVAGLIDDYTFNS